MLEFHLMVFHCIYLMCLHPVSYTHLDVYKRQLTAFIGNNDMVSYGIMDAILKKGYQIPDDLSVCGFDNDFASSLLPISLTTVEHYMEDKGKKAFNMIYEKIQEKDDFFVQDAKCEMCIRDRY